MSVATAADITTHAASDRQMAAPTAAVVLAAHAAPIGPQRDPAHTIDPTPTTAPKHASSVVKCGRLSASSCASLLALHTRATPATARICITGIASTHFGPITARTSGSATSARPMVTGSVSITIIARPSRNARRIAPGSSSSATKPGNSAR